ncbi:uncharacterized protein BX664DRAFT_264129, partial [Halteromyces radiatus]|uniref:uncharacterized protein n=1 Tax=Halteromyces radiatus TaxID=101107 RepID=UPI00221FBE3E
ESLSACPITFDHPSESQQLKGIGPKLALRLEKKMIDYCEQNGLPVPRRTKGKRKRKASTSTTEMEDNSSDDPATKRRKRLSRPYIPRYRTGGYAILLSLLHCCGNEGGGNHAFTKEEIIRYGQQFCNTSMDLPEPGSNYTAWSGIKILKEKGYVWQNGSPARFSLTESGELMAIQLQNATNDDGASSSSSRAIGRNPRTITSDSLNSTTDEPEVDLSLYVLDPEAYRRERNLTSTAQQSSVFQYTYLDTMNQPVRHLSQAEVKVDETIGCLLYKIQFSPQQRCHSRTSSLCHVNNTTCIAYLQESTADLVCPGLPARPLLPLHQEAQQSTREHSDFWPDVSSSSQQRSAYLMTRDTDSPASQPASQSIQSQQSTTAIAMSNMDVGIESPVQSQSATSTTLDIPTMATQARQEGSIWQPNEYTIVMVLDNREIKMKTNREYIQDKLDEKGVNVVKRALDLGDVIWVAKHVNTEEEMFLDIVVERKRLDDLVSSVKDGRFYEQKYRLKQCGSRKVFYIVEEYNKECAVKFGTQAIQSAMSSVQAVDRFYLKRTNSLDETIDYLVCLTKLIQKLYKNVTLQEIPTRFINRTNYLALKNELTPTISLQQRQQQQEDHAANYHVIPYHIFNQINSKSKSSTLQDLYTKMLMTIRGVTAEKAYSLGRIYPTPYHLLRAMKAANQDSSHPNRGKELAMLATKDAIQRRRWTATLSERLWDVWGKHHPI